MKTYVKDNADDGGTGAGHFGFVDESLADESLVPEVVIKVESALGQAVQIA